MTRRAISQQVAFETDISVEEAKRVVQMVLDGIVDAIAADGGIELRNFGVFKTHLSAQRQSRNPRTGEPVLVPPKPRIRFAAGKEMEKRLQQATASADSTSQLETAKA